MRIAVDKVFTDSLNYREYFGTHSESKPTTGIVSGSKLTETDTGDVYLFTEGSPGTWAKVSAGYVDPES